MPEENDDELASGEHPTSDNNPASIANSTSFESSFSTSSDSESETEAGPRN